MNKIISIFLITVCLGQVAIAQKSGINEQIPNSMLSIKGNLSVGGDTSYSRQLAPEGGAIIEGSVGIGTNAPDSSAILDLSATNKGVLVPRVTTVQRDSINNPANGLLVYDTDEGKFYYYADTLWKPVEGDGVAVQSIHTGAISFGTGSSTASDSTKLYWDNTNKRLGIRTSSPVASLQVNGAGSDSTTYALQIHNSTGTNNALVVKNDGGIGIGREPDFVLNSLYKGKLQIKDLAQIIDTSTTPVGNQLNIISTSGAASTYSGLTLSTGNSGTATGTGVNGVNATIQVYPINYSATNVRGAVVFQNMELNYNPGNSERRMLFSIPSNNTGSRFEFHSHTNGAISATTTRKLILVGASGNLILGTTSNNAGTNATRTFVIENGTSPTGNVADAVQLFSRDRVAGQAGLVIRSENGTQHIFSDRVGIRTITPNASLTVVGAGTTDTTFSFQVHNSTGTNNSLVVRDDSTIGVGTSSPDSSAQLDIVSTTRGFLPPRMTTTQRDAIISPAEGLVIYNSTTKKHQGYDGTQ